MVEALKEIEGRHPVELDLLRSRIDAVREEGLDNEYWLKAQARFTEVDEARNELIELAQSRPLDEAKLKGMLDQAVRLGVPKEATDHVEGKLQILLPEGGKEESGETRKHEG